MVIGQYMQHRLLVGPQLALTRIIIKGAIYNNACMHKLDYHNHDEK